MHGIFNERAKPHKETLKHLKSEIKRAEAKITNIQAHIKIDLRPMITITNDKITSIYGDEEKIVNIMRSLSPRERGKLMFPTTKANTIENIQSASTTITTSSSSSSSASKTTSNSTTPNAVLHFKKKYYDLEKKEKSLKRKVVNIFC